MKVEAVAKKPQAKTKKPASNKTPVKKKVAPKKQVKKNTAANGSIRIDKRNPADFTKEDRIVIALNMRVLPFHEGSFLRAFKAYQESNLGKKFNAELFAYAKAHSTTFPELYRIVSMKDPELKALKKDKRLLLIPKGKEYVAFSESYDYLRRNLYSYNAHKYFHGKTDVVISLANLKGFSLYELRHMVYSWKPSQAAVDFVFLLASITKGNDDQQDRFVRAILGHRKYEYDLLEPEAYTDGSERQAPSIMMYEKEVLIFDEKIAFTQSNIISTLKGDLLAHLEKEVSPTNLEVSAMKHIEKATTERLEQAAEVQEQMLEEVLSKRKPKVGQKVTYIAALTPNGRPVKATVTVTQVISNDAYLVEEIYGSRAVEYVAVKGLGTIRADLIRSKAESAKRFFKFARYL